MEYIYEHGPYDDDDEDEDSISASDWEKGWDMDADEYEELLKILKPW